MPTPMGDFHQPDKLIYDWEDNLPECVEWVKDGVPPRDAVMAIFKITPSAWSRWQKWYEEDVAAGFTANDSRLIELIDALRKVDGKLHHKLVKNGVNMALDGSADMTKFLLERKYQYKKPTKDIEVGTKEDTTFNINIVDSKPVDEE